MSSTDICGTITALLTVPSPDLPFVSDSISYTTDFCVV